MYVISLATVELRQLLESFEYYSQLECTRTLRQVVTSGKYIHRYSIEEIDIMPLYALGHNSRKCPENNDENWWTVIDTHVSVVTCL